MSNALCLTCNGHDRLPAVAHLHAGGVGPCRINGCGCQEFTTGEPRAEEEPVPRRMVLDIPEGYAVHIELVPIEAPAPLSAEEAKP